MAETRIVCLPISRLLLNNLKNSQFNDLISYANDCSLCPRMESRKRVLSRANGSLDSKVLFIAEAPGRLGADKYGIPLFGDQTGNNFEYLLEHAGLRRDTVFITNAVICNPRNDIGNNASPKSSEIQNCSHILGLTIEIVNPRYIVTLGAKALQALQCISPHDIKLSEHVANLVHWNSYHVLPLYHPSPRAMIHRPISDQISDYLFLGSVISNDRGQYSCQSKLSVIHYPSF